MSLINTELSWPNGSIWNPMAHYVWAPILMPHRHKEAHESTQLLEAEDPKSGLKAPPHLSTRDKIYGAFNKSVDYVYFQDPISHAKLRWKFTSWTQRSSRCKKKWMVRIGGADENRYLTRTLMWIQAAFDLRKDHLLGRVDHLSLYGIEKCDNSGNYQNWTPDTIQQLSRVCLAGLEALKNQSKKRTLDVLNLMSLGTVLFEDLGSKDLDTIPKIVVIDRGFTDTWSALKKQVEIAPGLLGKITSVFVSAIIYPLAWFSGWTADPISKIERCLAANSKKAIRFIVSSGEDDFFFGGTGTGDPNIWKRIGRKNKVVQNKYSAWGLATHPRAFHTLSPNNIHCIGSEYNSGTFAEVVFDEMKSHK